jgi:hypothetical protein
MASVFPLANYYTKSAALADNNLTTIYTAGDEGELAFDVTGISVAASTANADTCTIIRHQARDNTDYTLVFKGPVEADFPLQIEGLPIHLSPGDIIKAQATAGATHTLHIHVTGQKTTRSPKTDSK